MRKIRSRILILITILLPFMMVSCQQSNVNIESSTITTESKPSIIETNPFESTTIPSIPTITFTIYFHLNKEEIVEIITNNKSIIEPPSIPDKINHKSIGWKNRFGDQIDFSVPLENKIDLFPIYEPNYADITNQLTHSIISTNVKVSSKIYDLKSGLIETNVLHGYGSGVIFHEENGRYYVLTNAHVTDKNDRKYAEYTITDFKGNEYRGVLKEDSERPNYDLAVLSFAKGSEELHVVERASKNPLRGDEVIAIGQPNGQNNAIVYGTVINYTRVTFDDGEELKFDVIHHDGLIKRGSSGGALLSLDFKLVGINYAVGKSSTFDETFSYSIPIQMVELYLERYVFV